MSKLFIFSILVVAFIYCDAKSIEVVRYRFSSNAIDVKGDTRNGCLSAHNVYRAKHGVPAMVYDAELEKVAIQRAQKVAEYDNFSHDSKNPYGENLYNIWTTEENPQFDLCQLASDSWYGEIKDYDYDNPGFTGRTGHFTQMVWKSTTKLGCASSKSQSTGNIYVVCNYSPRGNIVNEGYFEENVLPVQ